jgi:hypothetical protein
MVIARTVTARASIVRKATVRRVIGRARSATVRTARRVVTVRTAIARRVTARMAIVLVRTAAPVASAAGVVPLS